MILKTLSTLHNIPNTCYISIGYHFNISQEWIIIFKQSTLINSPIILFKVKRYKLLLLPSVRICSKNILNQDFASYFMCNDQPTNGKTTVVFLAESKLNPGFTLVYYGTMHHATQHNRGKLKL